MFRTLAISIVSAALIATVSAAMAAERTVIVLDASGSM
jgi:hypothetical protein